MHKLLIALAFMAGTAVADSFVEISACGETVAFIGVDDETSIMYAAPTPIFVRDPQLLAKFAEIYEQASKQGHTSVWRVEDITSLDCPRRERI